MKKTLAIIAALILCSSLPAMAADAPPAARKAPAAKVDKLMPEPGEACHKMDMMGMMGSGMGGAMSPDLMGKMQEQMTRIRQSSDSSERQKLMQEHFQTMQEAMQAMRGTPGMGGCMQCCCCQQRCGQSMGGKNCKKGGNCARAKGTGTMGGGAPQSGMMPGAGMMEQRMDMMQTMMENMMEHQRQMQQNNYPPR